MLDKTPMRHDHQYLYINLKHAQITKNAHKEARSLQSLPGPETVPWSAVDWKSGCDVPVQGSAGMCMCVFVCVCVSACAYY